MNNAFFSGSLDIKYDNFIAIKYRNKNTNFPINVKNQII
jgi:hypothetical protein